MCWPLRMPVHDGRPQVISAYVSTIDGVVSLGPASPARSAPTRPARSPCSAAHRPAATDAELAERWRRAVAVKLPGHGINDPSFLQPDRPMSALGG